MATEVILPKVDMDMATGRISRWLAADGETIAKGTALFEIETDKAAMEIDAPADGILRIVVSDPATDVAVGAPVAWIYAEGEAQDHVAAPAPVAEAPAAPLPVTQPIAPPVSDAVLRATPLARRLARENGLDLAGLAGTGPRGRIQRADIEAALQSTPPLTLAAPAIRSCTPKAAPAPRAISGALHAEWLRQGAGVPVVLIHGFGAEIASWRPLLAEIPTDHPVLALDLPAHGKSLQSEAASFDDLVAQVEDTLTASGISQALLVGHSLGGAVAASIASGIRVEAAGLLLISSAGLGPEISGFVENFARATQANAVAAWLRELVHDANSLPDSFIRAVARDRADGTLSAAQIRFVGNVFAGQAQGFSIRAALAQLGCPVRIIFGTEDKVIPWRHALGLPGGIALHLFAQTGHMPQLEQRASVGRILRQMLA